MSEMDELETKRYYQLDMETILAKLKAKKIELDSLDIINASDETIDTIKKIILEATNNYMVSILEQARVYSKLLTLFSPRKMSDMSLHKGSEDNINLMIPDSHSDFSSSDEEEDGKNDNEEEIEKLVNMYKKRIVMLSEVI